MEKIKYVHFSNVMRCLLSEDENAFIGSVIQKLNWNIDDFNGSFENIELRKDFVYSNKKELEESNRRFKAIRSFVVAHPLNTDRHSEFGYDGKKKCIDIMLGLSGFHKAFSNYDRPDADFYLSYYGDDTKYTYKNEGHDYSEIYFTVYNNVERMLEFEKHLSKIRKKDLDKY